MQKGGFRVMKKCAICGSIYNVKDYNGDVLCGTCHSDTQIPPRIRWSAWNSKGKDLEKKTKNGFWDN